MSKKRSIKRTSGSNHIDGKLSSPDSLEDTYNDYSDETESR